MGKEGANESESSVCGAPGYEGWNTIQGQVMCGKSQEVLHSKVEGRGEKVILSSLSSPYHHMSEHLTIIYPPSTCEVGKNPHHDTVSEPESIDTSSQGSGCGSTNAMQMFGLRMDSRH